MPKRDHLLQTIGAIHAAGLDAALWPRALADIARMCGGAGATLEIFDKSRQQHRLFHAVGVPLTMEKDYVEYWAPRSPRVILGHHQKVGEVGWDYQIIDEAGMNRDPFYSELLPTAGFRYFISGNLGHTKSEFSVVAVQRTPRQGHVGETEIRIMRCLVPHLQQALDVAQRLGSAARAVTTLEEAFDCLNDGAALLRRDGRIIFCNAFFEKIVACGDGVRIIKGLIKFAPASAQARFEDGLAAIARLGAGQPDATAAIDFAVTRPSQAPAYIVTLRPLGTEVTCRDHAAGIVFIRDPMAHNGGGMQLLREMFDLTAAEAALAHALQRGVSPATYARENGLSPNTVYTHLRRIKEKTGWTRTAELSRRLNELQVPSRMD